MWIVYVCPCIREKKRKENCDAMQIAYCLLLGYRHGHIFLYIHISICLMLFMPMNNLSIPLSIPLCVCVRERERESCSWWTREICGMQQSRWEMVGCDEAGGCDAMVVNFHSIHSLSLGVLSLCSSMHQTERRTGINSHSGRRWVSVCERESIPGAEREIRE